MSDKYKEIFDQEFEEADGDTMAKFSAGMQAMRMAILKDVPVWMKFNMISHTLARHEEEHIIWAEVNELLKPNNEYDFNAFDYIDSKEKFYRAAGNSKIAGIRELSCLNMPFVKRVCKDCGETYTLTIGQVMFFCKHEYPLPKRCPKCLDLRKGNKPKIEPKKVDTGLYPGQTFKQPLNGFTEALKKAGVELIKEDTEV